MKKDIIRILVNRLAVLTGILLLLIVDRTAFAQDIHSTTGVVLPVSPATSYTVSSGQTVNISSTVSVTMGPGTSFASGSTVKIGIDNTNIYPTPPSTPANDYSLNWVYTRTYDEAGNELSSGKSFFDRNAKGLQSQNKNESTGYVLASQTLYDLQGRVAGTTLAAPLNNSAFAYNGNFVTNSSGTAYNYTNFDWNSINQYAKITSPDPVQNTAVGSLGWYYSNNNTLEPFVATTAYPYTRADFYHDGTGAPKRAAGVGDQLIMGSGRETTSNSFPVQNELNNYLAIRQLFFPLATSGSSPASMAGQALQSITTDQNGLSALSVTDLSRKNSLMTATADPSGWLAVQNTLNLSNVQGQYSINIHIDGPASVQGNTNDPQIIAMMHAMILNFSVNSFNQIVVTCTSGGIATWTGIGNTYVPPTPSLTGSYSFTITSSYPFTVTASNTYGPMYDQSEAPYMEPTVSSVQYFRLAVPSPVTITGSYTLYNMTTETNITPTFTSGNTLPVGYYKVMATAPSTNTANNVTVTYTNKYSNISYFYYNQLGQLIASIAPNGVQQLIASGLSGYGSNPSPAQIPFATLYSYDLQGRFITTATPDRGISNFIYRTDGKLRFSQSAYQAKLANAGQNNVEKFSYTNYDSFGRAVESGEYVVPSPTPVFSGLSSNIVLLDATGTAGNVPGCSKQSQVNTYYDLPATNLSLAGYIQDAGFLKGQVSYKTNSNSTTWYNYDDHGRVTWTVKQIAGLTGYKTVDYTYNDQGNVIKVDYQKGTANERFIHYYTYDADGRPVNVQTSRDDVNKKQQANYYYYLHGPLKRVELGDYLQGIDYTYTPQGWLKTINSPTGNYSNDPQKDGVNNGFANDVFGMQLEYFLGDYSRNNSIISIPTGQQSYYNGQVNGISWQSNKPASVLPGNPGIQNPVMYTYSYDASYQLKNATWGTPTFTGTPSFTGNSIFNEKNIGYDANGNITGLQRTYNPSTTIDDFSKYTYLSNTNQLKSVGNASNLTGYAGYTYDETGRMSSETMTGAPNPYFLTYDVTGNVTAIYADFSRTQLKESYTYDESGNRIKIVNPNGTTYYVYDSNGNVMAIYTGTTPTISEIPVYGSGVRLGTYTFNNNNYVYELRDNVGSVRVVINGTKNSSGQVDVTTYNDYFPYGSLAQNGGVTYRYDYQGAYAEKDAYTGWTNFKLRLYDSKIGRWLTTDPKNVGSTPYNGMGNNPVSSSDKDGGVPSDFHNEDGTVDHVEDGSTAQYFEIGSGMYKHYEFRWFDYNQQGYHPYENTYEDNKVVLTSLISKQEELNVHNPALQPVIDAVTGKSRTFCNVGFVNIIHSVASATNSPGLYHLFDNINGSDIEPMLANDIQPILYCSTYFTPATRDEATSAALNNDQLSVLSWLNPGHGHIAPFSVGGAKSFGQIANVGAVTDWQDINEIFRAKALPQVKYFILNPNIVPLEGVSLPVPGPQVGVWNMNSPAH